LTVAAAPSPALTPATTRAIDAGHEHDSSVHAQLGYLP
jgi:hypothetical protein